MTFIFSAHTDIKVYLCLFLEKEFWEKSNDSNYSKDTKNCFILVD